MTTVAASPTFPPSSAHRVTPKVAVTDGIVVAWRNLLSMLRTPEVLVFSSIQPIIFVLMFRFVFGGAITVPGESYVNFLMPGIFVQTVAFGAVTTAIGMADRSAGRGHRPLPIAPDGPIGRARRPHDRRSGAQRLGRDPDGGGRDTRRLPRADQRAWRRSRPSG